MIRLEIKKSIKSRYFLIAVALLYITNDLYLLSFLSVETFSQPYIVFIRRTYNNQNPAVVFELMKI